MKFNEENPHREFKVGLDNQIVIKDCGTIHMIPDEQITFVTSDGKEYDIVRKEWGFYATPSINGRLANQGFKTALVKNSNGMYYIMLVEKQKVEVFKRYLINEKNSLVKWLDNV